MSETCPYCNREFANSKALGSHVHYVHSNICAQERSGADQQRFERLLANCLSEKGLPKPRRVDKVERALCEIPEGLSSVLDRYREAFGCAAAKERLLKEVEKELLRESKPEEAG